MRIKIGICVPTTFNNVIPGTPQCESIARVMLVQDCHPHDDITNGDFVMQDNVSGGAAIFAPRSLKTYQGRFKILKEKELALTVDSLQYLPPVPPGPTGAWVWPGKYYRWEWVIDFDEPIRREFKANGGSGGYDDTVVNSFHLMANALNSDLGANITWYSRTTYTNI